MGQKLKKWFKRNYINLKRKPHIIPVIGLVIASMIYTFNLSYHSRTIAHFPSSYDAFLCFVTTLLSILSIFTFTNYYHKMNYFLLVLAILMTDFQIVLDILYMGSVRRYLAKDLDKAYDYMYSSYRSVQIHIIALAIVTILLILHPIYIAFRKRKKVKHETAKNH
ncbi:TPA: hypothetical protein GXZ54_06015 [bacterium]|jgi:hypothetical protein|nr:hypothetical protein [bacterium]